MARGDLTGAERRLVGPLLAMGRGRPGRESRRRLDGIPWRAREGAGRRAIPERYGRWSTVRRRFARRRDLGVSEAVLAAPADGGAAERARADARRHRRPRPPARGRCKGGRDGQALGRSRGGLSTKPHPRRDGDGLPLAIVPTPGRTREARALEASVEDMAPGARRLIRSATRATTPTGSGRGCWSGASCRSSPRTRPARSRPRPTASRAGRGTGSGGWTSGSSGSAASPRATRRPPRAISPSSSSPPRALAQVRPHGLVHFRRSCCARAAWAASDQDAPTDLRS